MKKLLENSSDGWSEQIQEALEDSFNDLEHLMYEVRNCVRGSYTNVNTAEDLADCIRTLASNLEAAADQVEYCSTMDDEDFDESTKRSKSRLRESEEDLPHVLFDFTGAPGYMEDGLVTVEQDSAIMVTWPNGYQEKLIVEVNSPYVGTEIIHNPKNFTESKSKKKKIDHKPYKMREEENPYEWDVKTEKKALRKQFPAMSDNELTIKAATKVAKKHGVGRKEVLASFKPSNNIKGEKTWGKDGKVFCKESIARLNKSRNLKEACLVSPTGSYTASMKRGVHFVGLEESEAFELTDAQKKAIEEMVQMDFETGHPMYDLSEVRGYLADDEMFNYNMNIIDSATKYYIDLINMGPAGILDEIQDGWSDDYVSEYTDYYDREDSEEMQVCPNCGKSGPKDFICDPKDPDFGKNYCDRCDTTW